MGTARSDGAPRVSDYTEVMSFAPLTVQTDPIVLDDLHRWTATESQARGEGCGAVCSFVGLVRATHKGRAVRFLEYEAHDALAVKSFAMIAGEIARTWPDAVVAICHRTGRLAIGEASVAIAVATAHRHESFQACRYAIERIKQIAPVWKHEYFEDGDAWVEGPVADPHDDAVRQEAMNRACA